jgi:hypothetical protein
LKVWSEIGPHYPALPRSFSLFRPPHINNLIYITVSKPSHPNPTLLLLHHRLTNLTMSEHSPNDAAQEATPLIIKATILQDQATSLLSDPESQRTPEITVNDSQTMNWKGKLYVVVTISALLVGIFGISALETSGGDLLGFGRLTWYSTVSCLWITALVVSQFPF